MMNSINKTARIAGFLYLLTVPLGIFGILYIPSNVIVSGDAFATINNIIANEMLFRLSIISSLTIHVLYIFIVLLMHKLLKPVNKIHANLMVIFMLVSVPISMLNEINNYAALILSTGTGFIATITSDQTPILVPLFLNLHEHGIFIAQIFWGLWLIPMGHLVFKSDYAPKFLGGLLIISGFSYLIDSALFFLFPSFDVEFSVFIGWGELLWPLWLLIKGVNVQNWEKCALE